MSSLVQTISQSLNDQITGHFTVPARPACYGQWGEWLSPAVRDALREMGLARPWLHQAQAVDAVAAGNHVVVATGTGSGKSLAAWVPALHLLAQHDADKGLGTTPGVGTAAGLGTTPGVGTTPEAASRFMPEMPSGPGSTTSTSKGRKRSLRTVTYRPTVLYLAPTKALAADQEVSVTKLAHRISRRIGVATIDGDADSATRTWTRDYADIVLSNPDFVHYAMLRRHENWARLFRGLALVVVDEFHTYRGVFGSNVALVVRRLLRVARHYGANPQVVFLSATATDPADSARNFLGPAFAHLGPSVSEGLNFGREVVAITADYSPAGERDILAVQCMEIPRDNAESAGEVSSESDARLAGEASIDAASVDVESTDNDAESAGLASTDVQRRAANTEAGELTALLVAHDARALTFVRSRPGTERVAEVAQKRLAKSASHLAGTVAAYRGGYLPEERRELEQQLRTGDIRALATTSALELGMDISGLDAVIVTGWPGTHSSFQQQIGRAGRAGSTGLAVFIGRDNPLDQYLLANPKLLATGRAEATVLDPTNPWILPHHLAAAAFELPLTNSDLMVFDLSNTVLIEHMVDAGMLTERPQGWYWNPAMRVSPHDLADIRGGGSTISIINSENGSLLGTVDGARADTTVHPGAIYIHQGVPFEVESLDDDVALVHPHRDEEIRTFAREESSVEILDTTDEIVFADGTWSRGMLVVRSRVIGYDVRRVRDGMFLGFVPLTMPMREFTTGAVWATLTEQATRDAGIATADLPGALHGAEHTMIALLPFFVSCDRWDLGGLSTALHPQTGRPTIIVHDAIAGGSGCAHRGFTSGKEWLEATLDTLTTCPCESGCPKCIQSPKCGNNNSPLSKPDARLLMDLLVRQLPEPSTAS